MNKSKFVAFILSFVPGLGHLYVGLKDRALIFFILFFGAIFGVVAMMVVTNNDQFGILLAFGLPVIWFAALVDTFSFINKSSASGESGEGEQRPRFYSNRKLITIALSVVPGAGHMYLGLQKQGVQLMSGFFFTAFLMGWLHLSLFLFVLPVIWFYSLFDALHKVEEEQGAVFEDQAELLSWFNNHPKLVGGALISLGCFTIFDRIISPFINWEIRNYIQTGIVALILISVGIKFLMGSKKDI